MTLRRIAVFLIASSALIGQQKKDVKRVQIAVGTAAPEGSPWHEILQKTNEDWLRITGGRFQLKIYAGGVLGDENDMTIKVRTGQLQAVGLSGVGLARVEPGVACLQIPMLIGSYEEFDYVRDRLAPRLEAMLEKRGFIVLQWSDVGWVQFFSKTPARTPAHVRKLRLFTSAGDPEGEKLYKEFGLKVVPLPVTEMLTSLSTNLIDAFDVPPLFAMLDQSVGIAKYMIDLKWCALAGATLLSRKAWEQTPPELRGELLKAARSAAERARAGIRKMGEDAVASMQPRGLNVAVLNAEEMAGWRAEAAAAYPKIRGRLVPEDLFDEAVRLHEEFQAKKATEGPKKEALPQPLKKSPQKGAPK